MTSDKDAFNPYLAHRREYRIPTGRGGPTRRRGHAIQFDAGRRNPSVPTVMRHNNAPPAVESRRKETQDNSAPPAVEGWRKETRHKDVPPTVEARQKETHRTNASQPKPRPMYTLGNYEHYYGKRAGLARVDSRLAMLEKEWFGGKKVLDVGCNAGFLTIGLAMLFSPAMVEGVDIDPGLIKKARINLANRASLIQPECESNREAGIQEDNHMEIDHTSEEPLDLDYFPQSCPLMFGALPIIEAQPDSAISTFARFPKNIRFRCGDWLHEPNPSAAEYKFDVILALSITKWIHLNYGDNGIKRFFKRCFHSLNPGGILLLEPQPFDSYTKADVEMTEEMRNHHRNILLKPENFEKHLLHDMKFAHVTHLGVAANKAKGFRRPVLLCRK